MKPASIFNRSAAAKLIFGAAAAAALLAAIPAAHADDWSKHYTVNGRPAVHLTVSDGDVEIVRGSGGMVGVDIHGGHYNISNDVNISESQSGNSVDVSIRPRSTHWFNWGLNSGTGLRVVLTVPSDADLDINSGDGNITAASVSGNVDLNTGDGNITSDALRGALRLHSGDGHINARNLDGKLEADTADGSMTIQGRFDSLDIHTGDGSITVEAAANSQPGASGWRIRSGDGSVTVRIPSSFRANLQAHTGDGHISVNFPLTVSGTLDESRLNAQINGGGPTLEITTGDGAISIQKQ